MITLIIGYPDSGKSKLAEDMVTEVSAADERVYIATMIPFGEEGTERVKKHRNMRAGKGFLTIEAPFDVSEAFDKAVLDHTVSDPGSKTVLLECISNLVANEMFERHTDPDLLPDRIREDMLELSRKTKNLFIVSNHFEKDSSFDAETLAYAEEMDRVNAALSKDANSVIQI